MPGMALGPTPFDQNGATGAPGAPRAVFDRAAPSPVLNHRWPATIGEGRPERGRARGIHPFPDAVPLGGSLLAHGFTTAGFTKRVLEE